MSRTFLACVLVLGVFAPDACSKDPVANWTSSRIVGTPDPPPPYRTEPVFADVTLVNPTEMIRIPGTDRWCVLQLNGTVLSFREDEQRDVTTMVDLKKNQPKTTRSFGIVFHRNYPKEPWCYIAYRLNAKDPHGTRLSRFRVNVSESPTIDADSETVLATWNGGGHGGGSLHFGPDGYLYVSIGDGQAPSPPDARNTGQDLSDLEASVLRIDVDNTQGDLNYRIPDDNPFVNTPGARGEIWAYGFRNPWKMSFHPADGTLWTGDVGWEMIEMVYRIDRGANYGWSLMEGSQVVKRDSEPPMVPITPPVVEHTHLEARSVTGGYFYGSDRLGDLKDTYLYGDYITGKIWGLRHDGTKMTWHKELADTPFQIICFALDRDGEVLVVSYDGSVHRLVETPPDTSNGYFPRLLSETGLFDSVTEQTPSRGVLPYEINAHHWADGTVSQQWIALPGDSQLSLVTRMVNEDGVNLGQFGFNLGQFAFPHNAVLAKTISYQADVADADSMRRLETQLLHRNGDAWNAYNYVWNDDASDAVLQDNVASDQQISIKDSREPGGVRTQTWHHASRDECLLCHTWKSGTVHGLIPAQLDLVRKDTGANQVDWMNQIGVFDKSIEANAKTIAPHDTSQSLEDRARSYLQLNCAHCHRRGGGGTAAFVLQGNVPLEKMIVVDAMPVQGGFGLTDPRIIAPGDPYRSVLLYRLVKSGRGHMPQFGSNVIDEQGVELIHDWIDSMDNMHARDGTDPTHSHLLSRSIARAQGQELKHLCDEFLKHPTSALALSVACGNGTLDDRERELVIAHAIELADAQTRELFERFMPAEQRVKRLGDSIDAAALLAISGDAESGRELFWSARDVTCRNCHRIGKQGALVGPDLDSIGLTRTKAEILASLLDPSANVDPKYQYFAILTAAGRIISGVVTRETDEFLHVVDLTGKETKIARNQIEVKQPLTTSVMPDRMLSGFTARQAANLLAYLSDQKKPTPQHHRSHQVTRVASPIKVDGIINETDWNSARPMAPFLFTWLANDDGPRQPTQAKLLWDDQYLYVALECSDGDVTATYTKRDDQVFRDDCVEVFASPDYDHPENYFNLEINALGTLLDNYRPDGEKTKEPWNPDGVQIGAQIDGTLNDPSDVDNGWSMEVAIPFDLFSDVIPGGYPSTGDRWRLNLHRLEDNMRVKSQWSPGDRNKSSFHTPEFFGTIEFVE